MERPHPRRLEAPNQGGKVQQRRQKSQIPNLRKEGRVHQFLETVHCMAFLKLPSKQGQPQGSTDLAPTEVSTETHHWLVAQSISGFCACQ